MSNTKIEIIFSGWQTIFLDRSASKAQTSLFGAENRNRSGQRLFQACQTLWILALPPLHKRQPLHRLAGSSWGLLPLLRCSPEGWQQLGGIEIPSKSSIRLMKGPQTRILGFPRTIRRTTHDRRDRKSTRLNSSHLGISYAVFC